MKHYKLLDHTADLGIECSARTRKALFVRAAESLADILVERKNAPAVKGQARSLPLVVEGADTADLLVNYLRELLYLFNGAHQVIVSCEMKSFTGKTLASNLILEPYSPKRHAVKTELKAVTYHRLSIEKIKNGWKARVIFDV